MAEQAQQRTQESGLVKKGISFLTLPLAEITIDGKTKRKVKARYICESCIGGHSGSTFLYHDRKCSILVCVDNPFQKVGNKITAESPAHYIEHTLKTNMHFNGD